MYNPGTIIYFDPFYFPNGKPAKAKYYLVLATDNDKTVFASLPSSKDYVPSHVHQNTGCCEINEANFNCYIISPEEELTECKKNFEVFTYLYGGQILTQDIKTLKEVYRNEGTDYQIFGIMKKDIFEDVKKCFKNSGVVKNKYKRVL